MDWNIVLIGIPIVAAVVEGIVLAVQGRSKRALNVVVRAVGKTAGGVVAKEVKSMTTDAQGNKTAVGRFINKFVNKLGVNVLKNPSSRKTTEKTN